MRGLRSDVKQWEAGSVKEWSAGRRVKQRSKPTANVFFVEEENEHWTVVEGGAEWIPVLRALLYCMVFVRCSKSFKTLSANP